jgi:beta-glucosidase
MTNIKDIVSKLTLEEKCAICSGINNWRTTPIDRMDIPSVVVADGPHGLRKEKQSDTDVANVMQESELSTCFPPAVTLASSWDISLAEKMGKSIAEECKEQKVDVLLGPGVNIKRNPLCGRNFEYFSEDPFLAGAMAANYVQGVQKEKVGTSLKHFAVNSQEYRRMTVSSEVDERAFREIYLPAFENTVKVAQPYTIMCSYNPINGVHSSDNKKLLWDILREEWGFKGIVVSDWGAVNDRVKGILAGLDWEMPTSNGLNDKNIQNAVESGELKIEDLDKVVTRMLKFVYKCCENREQENYKADYDKHFETACEVASKGAVLLKNEKNILPLKKGKKISVIGELSKEMRYQGSGSSRINPYKLTSFVDYLDEIKADYTFAKGYDITSDEPNKALIKEAVAVAKESDVVLLFVGLTDDYESEGFDRLHLELPLAHNELIDAIKEVNKNIVVVLAGGSPMAMPWIDDVKAILNMYLCGCAGGKACYKLLYGEANPSGKLAETFPMSLRDNPAYLYYQMGPQTVEYRESIYVGYRYFDKAKREVLFPFGYGLSYTTFKYSDLKLDSGFMTDKDTLNVSFRITNTGDMAGEEIAQVYVKDIESTIFREEKALKGFVKVALDKGESKVVSIELDKRSFAFYNVAVNDWTIENGEFEILVGASSRDIKLSNKIIVSSDKVDIVDYSKTAPMYYKLPHCADYPDKDFEVLLGRKLQDNIPLKKGQIDYNSTFADLSICGLGKVVKWAVTKFSANVLPKGSPEYLKKMCRLAVLSMPLRNAFNMTNGMISQKAIDGLIKRCNGRPFQGLGMMIGGAIKKQDKKDKNPNYLVK